MKASSFAGGSIIKAADAKTPFLALIRGAEVVTFKKQGGGEDRKLGLILDVNGEEKKLALNKTTLDVLIAGYGDDTDLWTGKRIAVYFDPSVEFGGKKVGGVRIKLPGVKSAAEKALEAQRAAEAMFDTSFEPAKLEAPAAAAKPSREPGEDDEPEIL